MRKVWEEISMNHSNEWWDIFEGICVPISSLSNDFLVGSTEKKWMFRLWGIFINMTDWMHPVSHDLIFLTSFYETCRHVVRLLFLTMERHFHFFANITHIEEVDRDQYLVLMVTSLFHSLPPFEQNPVFSGSGAPMLTRGCGCWYRWKNLSHSSSFFTSVFEV